MRIVSSIGLLTLVAAIQAQEPIKLTPGMTAPKLEVGGWAKYDAPKTQPGRFRVVEFWATWCGPCKTSIPHLTELAKKHKDKVDFVGVSVWERGEDTVGMVKKFVTEYGDKMDYRVAYDTPANTMAQTWMTAAEQPGIPTAFILNDKDQVMWVGHPMAMDKPLEDAISGKLDVAAEKDKFVKAVNSRRESQKAQAEIQAAVKLYREGKTTEAEAALDTISKKSKESAEAVRIQRLMVMYKPGSPEGDKLVNEMLAEGGDSLQMVAQYGMRLIAPNGPADGKEKAKKIADTLVTKDKDAIVLYFAGILYTRLQDKAAAMKAFDAALAAAPNDANVKGNAAFLEAVKKEKEAAATTGSGR
jgi:thiol-disulfide isomerase/thioredoxin